MALIVQKFGGTSVGSIERIKNVARRIVKWKAAGHDIVVVPSAMSGETNRLIGLAKQLREQPDPRELDVITSTGEQVTVGLLALALMEQGVRAKSYTGAQVKVLTDSAFTKARIQAIDDERLRADLADGCVPVVAGFQGVDSNGSITTLGRGGSDTSAVALAAALKADECLIFTDVDGVYTTDPRIVPEARRLESITFEVLSSLTDPLIPVAEEAASGTLITFEEDEKMEQAIISGIAFSRDEAKISVMSVPDRPGIAYAILGPIADANIDVDMIIQNAGVDGKTDFSFTVPRNDYAKAMEIAKTVMAHIGATDLAGDNKVCKVSMVGVGMRSHVGIASQMFRTLAEEGINIQMISTSEIKISVVVDEKYMELAVRVLHRAFGLEMQPG
jgi:aspartate kinase